MMKKTSTTYRFLSTFTAFVLLLSLSTPAILHAAGFGSCTMAVDITEHKDHSSPEVSGAEHCDKAAHLEEKRDETDAGTNIEECKWNFSCSCSIDEATATSNAIPILPKISAGYNPSVIQILDSSPQTNTVKPTEIFVSLYSPPIFLINSSFLN